MKMGVEQLPHYEGVLAFTQKRGIQYRCRCGVLGSTSVYRVINAVTDPGLAQALCDGGRQKEIAGFQCEICRWETVVHIPTMYHDPATNTFVLVLPQSIRHLELRQRAEFWNQLAEDDAFVPQYVLEHAIVYGAQGLQEYLEDTLGQPYVSFSSLTSQKEISDGIPTTCDKGQVTQSSPLMRDPTSNVVEHWVTSGEGATFAVLDQGQVRLCARVDPIGFQWVLQDISVILQMHALPSYPLVTLSLAGPAHVSPLVFPLDIARMEDRGILQTLAREFIFRLEGFEASTTPVHTSTVRAPLEDNVRYFLTVASDRLESIPPKERSFAKAWDTYSDPLYDRWGDRNPLLSAFNRDALTQLEVATDVVKALQIVQSFAVPEAEQFIILIRGFSLEEWNRLRRGVLERVMELGLWPGDGLANDCVSEGFASSRRELIQVLYTRFSELCNKGDSGLSQSFLIENWHSLKRQSERTKVSGIQFDRVPVMVESERTNQPNGIQADHSLSSNSEFALDLPRGCK